MGKKIRAAKASLVAAFLAAGGGAAGGAVALSSPAPAATIGGSTGITQGDPLVRFLKLDGFPAFLKIDGFAAFYKAYEPYVLADAATLYDKYPSAVADLLSLYQKADAGPLGGIVSGLEAYYKYDNLQPLKDFLETPGAFDAYVKFQTFFSALEQGASEGKPSAFDFFYKETGIAGNPIGQFD
jgi:hypothetical protein